MFDLIIVVHNDLNKNLCYKLMQDIGNYMTDDCHIYIQDNSTDNKGFAAACNEGAAQGNAPIVGFINPDAVITGDFMTPVKEVFASDPKIMITGGNFNKNPVEIQGWGLKDWVCGAAMFVRRDFWASVGGFDEQFVWAYEETDLIRRCESMNYICKSLNPTELPILHSSPLTDSQQDTEYKNYWMAESGARFWKKWHG